jgi:hypothetical protein
MNLVSFSIRTKGTYNFARRLRTVFTRFGFTESPIRHALYTIIDTLQRYNGAPTFFIPAVVLGRHPQLISELALDGAESCWPDGNRAALAISGDIDSATVQVFFLRILEAR